MADRTIGRFLPSDGEAKTSTFPQFARSSDASGARPIALFDAGADEALYFTDIAPQGLTTPAKVIVTWAMVSATTGNVILDATVEAVTDGDSMDTDSAESLDTANTTAATAVPGTAGHIKQTSITLTNNDSIAAGDYFRVRFRRVGANGSDTATGDLVLLGIELRDDGG